MQHLLLHLSVTIIGFNTKINGYDSLQVKYQKRAEKLHLYPKALTSGSPGFSSSRTLSTGVYLVVALNTGDARTVVDISSLDPSLALARVMLRSSNSSNPDTEVGSVEP